MNVLFILSEKAVHKDIGGFLVLNTIINVALIFYVCIRKQVHRFDGVRKHIHQQLFDENS